MTTKKRQSIGFLATLLLGVAFATAQAGGEGKPAPEPQSGPSARGRLDQAAAIVAALKGVKGPERLAGMREAAAAFDTVAADFATDRGVQARALWEAGECWRRASELEKAADAYARLLAGEPGRYRQRGLFERASMLRRLKDFDGALQAYQEAGKLAVEGVRAHESRIWVARVHELRGDPEAALASYRAAVDGAVGPRRTIEACDALAKALVRRGDLDGAAAAITRADASASAEIGKGGQQAARLQRVLEGMGARRQLQRARDKANGSAEDAVKLEQDRGAAGR